MANITNSNFYSLANQYQTLYMGCTNANGDYNEMKELDLLSRHRTMRINVNNPER